MIIRQGKNSFLASGGMVLTTDSLKQLLKRCNPALIRDVELTIKDGFTQAEAGFFDYFPTLAVLTLPKTMKKIPLTETAAQHFRENGTLICGTFDSYAETFAREQKLRFLHEDIELARVGDAHSDIGIDIVSLQLFTTGKPCLNQKNFCPGISAGNNGGGEVNVFLPRDFYGTLPQKEIAARCWGRCRAAIEKNRELSVFLTKARRKNGYYFAF